MTYSSAFAPCVVDYMWGSGGGGGDVTIRLVTDTVGMPSASYLVGHSRDYQLCGQGDTELTRPTASAEGDNVH